MEVTGKVKVKKSAKGTYYTSMRRKSQQEDSEKEYEYAPLGLNFLSKDISLEDGSWINIKKGFITFYKIQKEDETEEIRTIVVVQDFEDAPKPVKQDTKFEFGDSDNDDLPF